MKYEIPLHRSERKTETVFADSPHEALKMALAAHEGFQADSITELLPDPEEPMLTIPGETFEHVHTCEYCDRRILTGDQFYSAEDEHEGTMCLCLSCGPFEEGQEPEVA